MCTVYAVTFDTVQLLMGSGTSAKQKKEEGRVEKRYVLESSTGGDGDVNSIENQISPPPLTGCYKILTSDKYVIGTVSTLAVGIGCRAGDRTEAVERVHPVHVQLAVDQRHLRFT